MGNPDFFKGSALGVKGKTHIIEQLRYVDIKMSYIYIYIYVVILEYEI